MPIIQTNVWVCDLCGAFEAKSKETNMWSDPIVLPPTKDWAYLDNKLACLKCVQKAKKEN